MKQLRLLTVLLILSPGATPGLPSSASPNQDAEASPLPSRILIAFTSLRDDRNSGVYFYQLDESGSGTSLGRIPSGGKRSDHHPALSADGSLCIYASEVVASPCTIAGRNIAGEEDLDLSAVNTSPNALMAPSLATEANLLAFEAWNRPGSSGRWDIVLYDLGEERFLNTPLLNSAKYDERKPSINANGNRIAFTTNHRSAESLTDIALYDRPSSTVSAPPGLNSPHMDNEPALSADGHWLAFVSDRPGGAGARDIWLYDLAEGQLVELPGLNSVGQEQSPTLSADGRFLAFVSERLDGDGERDIYLYDRTSQMLVSTPELNSPEDEYDPVMVILPGT